MENMKIKNAIISKQPENSENFKKFLNLAEEKKINVIIVEKGNQLNIEKNLYFQIFWPVSSKFIKENPLNNNSIVCKLCYKNFTMLFTGDIEEETEKELINLYKEDSNILNSTVLKVAHHGSNSSSTDEFIKKVNPRISLIGVGKNNLYGHPSENVINRLKNNNSRVYRTDKDGEISIVVNRKGKIVNIQKFIK